MSSRVRGGNQTLRAHMVVRLSLVLGCPDRFPGDILDLLTSTRSTQGGGAHAPEPGDSWTRIRVPVRDNGMSSCWMTFFSRTRRLIEYACAQDASPCIFLRRIRTFEMLQRGPGLYSNAINSVSGVKTLRRPPTGAIRHVATDTNGWRCEADLCSSVL